jgi:hypothetical protein
MQVKKAELIKFLTLPGEKATDVLREFNELPEKDQTDLLRWADSESVPVRAAA